MVVVFFCCFVLNMMNGVNSGSLAGYIRDFDGFPRLVDGLESSGQGSLLVDLSNQMVKNRREQGVRFDGCMQPLYDTWEESYGGLSDKVRSVVSFDRLKVLMVEGMMGREAVSKDGCLSLHVSTFCGLLSTSLGSQGLARAECRGAVKAMVCSFGIDGVAWSKGYCKSTWELNRRLSKVKFERYFSDDPKRQWFPPSKGHVLILKRLPARVFKWGGPR